MKLFKKNPVHREAKRLAGKSPQFVIQTVLADGFTYWFAGHSTRKMGNATVNSVIWSAYWEEAIKFEYHYLASEAKEKLIDKDTPCEVLRDRDAAFDKAFDLDPDNLNAYMKYEREQRSEFSKGLKEVDNGESE